MSRPLVSVVMPVRSGGPFVAEAVSSILVQTMEDLELIVVDDGADEATRAELRGLVGDDTRMSVVGHPGRGIVSALNAGCAMARGKYVARMDADDLSRPDRLRHQLAVLDADADIGVVGGQIRCSDLSGEVTWLASYPLDDAGIRGMLPIGNPFAHPAVTMRRDALRRAGGYRATCPHAEDYELWARLLRCTRGANVESEVLLYRVHDDQSAFRHWREQTLSMLAVQAAVRARETAGRYPLDDVEVVDEAFLRELGVADAAVQTAYVASLVSQAILARRIGSLDASRALLAGAKAELGASRLAPGVARRLWATTVAAALEDGHVASAMGGAAKLAWSVAREPGEAVRIGKGIAVRSARRWTTSVPSKRGG